MQSDINNGIILAFGYTACGVLCTWPITFTTRYSIGATPDGGTNAGGATNISSYTRTLSYGHFTTAYNSQNVFYILLGY